MASWGSYPQATVPVNLSDVATVSAGYDHSCGLQIWGSVTCWGDSNDQGQLNVPRDLGNVTSVSCGYKFTCASTATGLVKCWGINDHLQTSVPGDLSGVASVSAGWWHACALKNDGAVRCWGGGKSVGSSDNIQPLPAAPQRAIGTAAGVR